jgi:hypothetical protein
VFEGNPAEGQLLKELLHWESVCTIYQKILGHSELPFAVRVPVHAGQYGVVSLARAHFGSMEGSLALMKMFRRPCRIPETDFWVQAELPRKHTYMSMLGLRMDIPWNHDKSVRRAKNDPGHQFLYWHDGRIPLSIIDMDVDVSSGAMYVYEISRHKFGWLWGIYKPMDVPVRGGEEGEIVRMPPLNQVNPALVEIYGQIGRYSESLFGNSRTNLTRALLVYSYNIGKSILGDALKKIYILKPDAVLQYRDEFYIYDQFNLSAFDNSMQKAVRSLWKTKDRADGWLECRL